MVLNETEKTLSASDVTALVDGFKLALATGHLNRETACFKDYVQKECEGASVDGSYKVTMRTASGGVTRTVGGEDFLKAIDIAVKNKIDITIREQHGPAKKQHDTRASSIGR